jgi:hypothetical protein
LIRLLNFDFGDDHEDDRHHLLIWQEIARFSFEYLIDLSQSQLHALRSLPTDLLSCESISDMIGLIFRMYTIECSLYQNVNHFLRCFPVKIVGKFLTELKGILHYNIVHTIIGCQMMLLFIAVFRVVEDDLFHFMNQ